MAITQPGAMTMSAPAVTAPACGGVSRWPTEPVVLSWTPMSGAATYTVEIDCENCSHDLFPWVWVSQSGTPWKVTRGLQSPTYSIDVVATVRREGGKAMRWRVWAVDRDGTEGTKSDWCVTGFNDSGLPTPTGQTP
jgi:hypothetical protein